ncbi:MAG: hypothetical protein IJX97_05515 [Clostridia bacterium]|nr:hypothetical protein [Clostridia bacterium]
MTQTNNYDKLYENMRQRFSVSQNNTQYTIGEYMLMKADVKKADDAALPVAVKTAVAKSEVAVSGLVSFVDEKLTIKQPPVKDKTIRSFPFRASASAFLTASVACAFLLSFVLIGAKSLAAPEPAANEYKNVEQMIEESGVDYNDIIIR